MSNLSLKEIPDEDEIENNSEDPNPGGEETLMYDTIDHLILENINLPLIEINFLKLIQKSTS